MAQEFRTGGIKINWTNQQTDALSFLPIPKTALSFVYCYNTYYNLHRWPATQCIPECIAPANAPAVFPTRGGQRGLNAELFVKSTHTNTYAHTHTYIHTYIRTGAHTFRANFFSPDALRVPLF